MASLPDHPRTAQGSALVPLQAIFAAPCCLARLPTEPEMSNAELLNTQTLPDVCIRALYPKIAAPKLAAPMTMPALSCLPGKFAASRGIKAAWTQNAAKCLQPHDHWGKPRLPERSCSGRPRFTSSRCLISSSSSFDTCRGADYGHAFAEASA